MKIRRTSIISGIMRTRDIPVTQQQIEHWLNGALIQDAMPDLSDEDREFIMSGATGEEWRAMREEQEADPNLEKNYPPAGTPETALVYVLGGGQHHVAAHAGRYFHARIACAGCQGDEIGMTDVPDQIGVWVFENGKVEGDPMTGIWRIAGDWRRARLADFDRFGLPCPIDLDDGLGEGVAA